MTAARSRRRRTSSRPQVSLGAPPDPFNRSGQVWNLPPFNPHALAAEDFRPYQDILRANMRHAGALRIDHILGAARQFWVPRGAAAADGAYVTFPAGGADRGSSPRRAGAPAAW